MKYSYHIVSLLCLLSISPMTTATIMHGTTDVHVQHTAPLNTNNMNIIFHHSVQDADVQRPANNVSTEKLNYGGGGSSAGGKGGGCVLNPAADFDPVLLLLMLCAVIYLRQRHIKIK